MIFTSKNAPNNVYNSVFKTHFKIAICQFWYFTHNLRILTLLIYVWVLL